MATVSLFSAPPEKEDKAHSTPQPPTDTKHRRGPKHAVTAGRLHAENSFESTASGQDPGKRQFKTIPPFVPKIKTTVMADLSFADHMGKADVPGKALLSPSERSSNIKVSINNPTPTVSSDTMVIGHPIRLPTPANFNAPPRASISVSLGEPALTPRRLTNEEKPNGSNMAAAAAAAHMSFAGLSAAEQKALHKGNHTLQKVYAPESELSPFMSPRAIKDKLTDFNILAHACNKARRGLEEGYAFFNMGVVHDNAGDFERAINCYKKFLRVCRDEEDIDGQAIALNCMGVDYFLIGGDEYMAKALKCHKQHYQIAAEIDKVVALVNIGLCYRQVEEAQKATQILHEAVRISSQLNDIEGERVASGNLGAAQLQEQNLEGAKKSYFTQLELSKSMQDVRGVCSACHQLGLIANSLNQYNEAAASFEQARKIALALNDKLFANEMGIAIGVAKGNSLFKRRMAEVQQTYRENYAPPSVREKMKIDLSLLLDPQETSDEEDSDDEPQAGPAGFGRKLGQAPSVLSPMPPPEEREKMFNAARAARHRYQNHSA